MSIAANLPPRAKRLSLRIRDLGIPIPARVSTFLDGPEVHAFDGARAWGIEGIDTDKQLKLTWASGRLPDLLDLAIERDATAASRYLPVAAIGTGTHMFAVDVTDPALPVFVFERDTGFKQWAENFDAFTQKLVRRGEKDPAEKLDSALETARELDEQKSYAKVIELLTPVVSRFPKSLTENDNGRDELGEAYSLMGTAYRETGKIDEATECFEAALALGNEEAGLGLCNLLLEHHHDYEKLVTFGEKARDDIWRGSESRAWFQIRNYLGHGYLLTGRPRDAFRAYHQISELSIDDPPKIREAVEALQRLRNNARADRDTIDAILKWLDVPPPELPADKLAALRAWWLALPEAARVAIREGVEITDGAEPTDAQLVRISRLTDLTITESGLTDIAWVKQLEHLDDLDLTENDINDLSPVAELRLLTRLDVSNNKITSLRPLATMTRLKRVVVDENPIAGLEGLENLQEMEELHCTEAGLESLEPLRGLRGLTEITIYENQIQDISPLADCPRLKEISCFTNPLTRGFAALGKLPWLESIDAGDDSKYEDLKALRDANPIVSIDQWYPDDDKLSLDVVKTPDPTLRDWWNALPRAWKKPFADEMNVSAGKEPDDDDLLSLSLEDHISIEKQLLPDLEPLRRLSRLDYLNLEQTGISDLSPLSRLPRLRDLLVRDNKIDLVSLAPAERLEELYMDRCSVSSLIGLERCRALRELHAEDNHVDDLRPLAELTELREIDLEGNRVSDLTPLANLTKLRTLLLGLTRITDLAPLARCIALRELEVWGTPALANALVLANLPQLTKVISHGSIPASDIAELRRRNPRLEID